MKPYTLNTKLEFGKYSGNSLKEVVESDPNYIEWCILNLGHFRLSDSTVAEIRKIQRSFRLSVDAEIKRKNKQKEWDKYGIEFEGKSAPSDNCGFLGKEDFDFIQEDLESLPITYDKKQVSQLVEVEDSDYQSTKHGNKFVEIMEHSILLKEMKGNYTVHAIRFNENGQYVKIDQIVYVGE